MRIGAIGLDSSHTLHFTERLQDLYASGASRCHVTTCWDTPTPLGMNESEILITAESLQDLGISLSASLEELLASVDGVLVLTADGTRHFQLAMKALRIGLPTFIDKPLTCSAADATAILRFTHAHGAKCYSSSSLRFVSGVPSAAFDPTHHPEFIEASGPVAETPSMPGLWYYGCHTFEFVDSLWKKGGGVSRVRANASDSEFNIELAYRDGRRAVIRLDRSGKSPFAARIGSANESLHFAPDLGDSYDHLVGSIARFFETGIPGVPLENIVESIASIECCHVSIARSGEWVELPEKIADLTCI